MEKNRLTGKYQGFRVAVQGFKDSLDIVAAEYPETVADTINNGKIQKFEYCTELTWKLIKVFLFDIHGIETKTPKQAIKEFFVISDLDDEKYELFMDMLDDRNRLSHMYSDNTFLEVLNKLPIYLGVITDIQNYLGQHTGE